jgi:hypothetical protein
MPPVTVEAIKAITASAAAAIAIHSICHAPRTRWSRHHWRIPRGPAALCSAWSASSLVRQ